MTAPYVVGDSSPFLKRVLIPFWVVRIFIMLISIVVYGLLLAGLAILENDRTTRQKLEKDYNTSLNLSVLIALAVISLLITLACLILDIVCIVKRAKRTLSPRFFLIVNVIQSLIFTLSFIFSFIGARTSAVGVVISVLIWLSFIGLLIYAAVIFHKFRKGSLRGEYKPAHNPESAAFVQTVSTDYNQEYPKPPAAYADGQQYGAPQPYGAPQSYGAPQPYGGAPQTGYTGYNPQQPQSYEMGNR